mmetsp:Transcript_98040/g.219407  ORF Transcript_98040/g.219407 Transcript_98040/m.219407 type:complete len:201 (+) Transcript_98040:431-1033(+)
MRTRTWRWDSRSRWGRTFWSGRRQSGARRLAPAGGLRWRPLATLSGRWRGRSRWRRRLARLTRPRLPLRRCRLLLSFGNAFLDQLVAEAFALRSLFLLVLLPYIVRGCLEELVDEALGGHASLVPIPTARIRAEDEKPLFAVIIQRHEHVHACLLLYAPELAATVPGHPTHALCWDVHLHCIVALRHIADGDGAASHLLQ